MYKVVSMYTENTPYEEEIKELGISCDKFGTDYKFYPIVNLKDWVKNTQQKAQIVQQALNEFQCDIVWLDADAVILKKLELFDDLTKQDNFNICIHRASYKIGAGNDPQGIKRKISAFIKNLRYPQGEILSGTIYFKNSALTKDLVNEWVSINQQKKEWDQRTLQEVIDNGNNNYVVKQLPESYVKIVARGSVIGDLNTGGNYIGHKQFSRKYRNSI